ncbi:hypothetical protein Vafri_17056 [Volvox africanus]|nr:hypothetical protein Vafri_17056 [Volvox africanus]
MTGEQPLYTSSQLPLSAAGANASAAPTSPSWNLDQITPAAAITRAVAVAAGTVAEAEAEAEADDSHRQRKRRRCSVVVSLFEVPYNPANVAAFIAREHEFRFVAVEPYDLNGAPIGRKAVVCARNTDAAYRAARCPPDEWARRWAVHGISSVWRDDVLPCRVYLRHCVLAARSLGPEAEDSFLNDTYLADRSTTIGEYLRLHPDIMDEQPPLPLAERYSG